MTEDFKLRVIKERDDLLEKITKLTIFLLSDSSLQLTTEEKDLMWRQLYSMLSYGNVLADRIVCLNNS